MTEPRAVEPLAGLPRRVVVVHGYTAHPQAHWFPWLREQLRAGDVAVDLVALPTPQAPRAAEWQDAVAAVLGTPDADTWVVAHSLGVVTTLRVLAASAGSWRLGGLVAVAGFTGRLPDLPELDGYLEQDVDVEALVRRIDRRVVLCSDDDAVVPQEASLVLAGRLAARAVVVRGAGHFMASEGVTELPEVLAAMGLGAEGHSAT